jgi:broad specificity phosphatase PhoE
MTLYLVRHANAGARGKWLADDRSRPLTPQGRYQAADLVEVLGQLDITRILSSPFRRCIETVAPLGAALGIAIEIDHAFAEGPGGPAIKVVRSLVTENAVVCSHGDIIPAILEALTIVDGVSLGVDPRCQKASVWILEGSKQVDSGKHTDSIASTFVSASYIPPPR